MVVGEVSDSVDVRFVASEGLDAPASSNVPKLGGGVATARDKSETIVAAKNRYTRELASDINISVAHKKL